MFGLARGLLVAAVLIGASAPVEAQQSQFPPEMERLADAAGNQWRRCLVRAFTAHVGRGLDQDSAAESALRSCATEERSLVLIGIRAGIPAQTAMTNIQFMRHEQKQNLLRLYQQAAANAARRGQRQAQAQRTARTRQQQARPRVARRPAAARSTAGFTPLQQ